MSYMLMWLLLKIVGIVLVLLGGFFMFLGPGVLTHQPEEMSIGTVIVGVIMLLVGLYLVLA